MKKHLYIVYIFLVVAVLTMSGSAFADVDDQHLVLFKQQAVPSNFASDVTELGGEIVYQHHVGIAVVAGLSDDAAAEIAASRKVIDVQRDDAIMLEFDPLYAEEVIDGNMGPPVDPTEAYFYSRQWNMRAIEADKAWQAKRLGSAEVTVAILDTGIDYTYPDLDGLVDLERSISFVPSDDYLVDYYFPGKHYVTDLRYHGTHVAATVASNALVAAGVTSKTTLIGVKVCNIYGSCPFSSIIAGVLHAADNGADIANMSLGGSFMRPESEGLIGYIARTFNYAKKANMIVVVSAGNNALDLDYDPSLYKTYCDAPNTICVSATAPTSGDGVDGPWYEVDAPAPYTNYGVSAISVAAPGGANIYNNAGWVWAACSQTSLVLPHCQIGNWVLGASGTSMAAPHVTGLAALVVEDVGPVPVKVKKLIEKTADDLGLEGTDPYYGKGRINVGTYVNK